MLATLIGQYVIQRYRARAKTSGHFTVAQQLRKQGYPLEMALAILCGRIPATSLTKV